MDEYTSKRLQILHVTPSLNPDVNGGVQRHVSDLANESSKRHNVTILAFTNRDLQYHRYVERRADLLVYWQSKHVSKSSRLDTRWPELEQSFKELVTKIHPDVVHLHQLNGLSTELVAISKSLAPVVCVTLHDYLSICPTDTLDCTEKLCFRPGKRCYSCLYPDNFSRRRDTGLWHITNPFVILLGNIFGSLIWSGRCIAALNARKQEHINALKLADGLISPSRALSQVFMDVMVQNNINIISHGVKIPSDIANHTVQHNPLRFGFIGSHRVKGLELLLRAFSSVDPTDVELWIYSNMHSYTRPLRRRLLKLASKPNIYIKGSFDPNQIDAVFKTFDVLVAPSVWIEPFGLVAAEAIVRGKPTIAADSCGFEETVIDGVNGLLFKRGDKNALAETIQRCISTPSLVSSLRSGCKKVKSIATEAMETEHLYMGCLENNNTCQGEL
jgi:glycosyltransferase involved in cell wall biosynthesis